MICGCLTARRVLTALRDSATQVAWRVTNSRMEHYHDKGLLSWLDGGMASPCPRIILHKQTGPEQWGTWKLAASNEELGTWTGHFIGTSHSSHSNYFFHYINHISYKLVFPFLLF